MSSFNFKNLIKRYSKSPAYILKETGGGYDYSQGGIWVDGVTEEILIEDGAVVPLKPEELEYGEGGSYTLEDKKLYCYKKMVKGDKIKHKGKNYTIDNSLNYEDFDIGLYIYFIKRGGG